MRKPKKKTFGKTQQALVDRKYYGDEPILSKDSTASEIMLCYNWHNYIHTNDDSKQFVIDFLKFKKAPKNVLKRIQQADAIKFHSVGWNARTLTLGGSLPDNVEDDMWNRINALANSVKSEEPEAEVSTRPVVSIQERIANRASDLISHLESELDTYVMEGSNDFDPVVWMRQQVVKPAIAKLISEYYQPLYSELYDTLQGKDEYLKEYYDHWKKPALKKYVEFVKSIVSAAETITSTVVPVSRKPRKKKEKPAAIVVAKMKYKEKDDGSNLSSVNPVTIVGANQLWTYNTRTRTLSVYMAIGPAGLSVKGTTITGFDEKTSITKKVRKPEQTLPRVLEGGKLVLRKVMDEIKCKPKEANGRINTDTILLKVLK